MLSHLADRDTAKLQQACGYDLLMRLPMLLWSLFLGLVIYAGLQQYIHDADPAVPGAMYSLNVAMRLSVIGYLVVIAATVVTRTRPAGRARGPEPRISALLGTFLFTIVVVFPRRDLAAVAGTVSTLLTLAGNAFAVLVLTQLRGSFSIMAEARQLVTRGAYRRVRHPLYLAEVITAVGVVMQFLSFWTAFLLAVQIAFQLRRMYNEEVVLSAAFPEYDAYKATTFRLIPGVF